MKLERRQPLPAAGVGLREEQVAVDVDGVEEHVDDGDLAHPSAHLGLSRHAHAPLELLEAGAAALVERDDLAIQHRLGQGWMEAEFAVAGVSPKQRGARFEEYVHALRAIWGPDPVTFEGRFYQVPESGIGPKPTQAGGPPILVGAAAPASLERTARMGLGINPG